MSDRKNSLLEEAQDIAVRVGELLERSTRFKADPTSRDQSHYPVLAHYTSLQAIVSMLESQNGGLRLSDSSTMNDPEEGLTTEVDRDLYKRLKKFGANSWLYRRYGAANICCFVGSKRESEQLIYPGDDLLFWRLYGDDCRGVSITIPQHKSKELIDSSLVRKVTYTDASTSEMDLDSVQSLLEALDYLRKRSQENNCWTEVNEFVLPVFDRLLGQRFLHKRSHYEMEREYRAIVFDSLNDGKKKKIFVLNYSWQSCATWINSHIRTGSRTKQ